MRDHLAVLTTAAAVVAVLTSACGSAPTTGTPEPSAGTSTPAPTLPPRPRQIDLTGVDTCTLLTPEQQRRLGTDRAPVASVDTDRYGKRASSPRFGYSVKVVTQEDATVYLTNARDAVARVVSAAGFPAVENHPPGDERGCFVDVSTNRAAPHPGRACRGLLGWALSVNSTPATFSARKRSLVSSSPTRGTSTPGYCRLTAWNRLRPSQLTRE